MKQIIKEFHISREGKIYEILSNTRFELKNNSSNIYDSNGKKISAPYFNIEIGFIFFTKEKGKYIKWKVFSKNYTKENILAEKIV